MKKYWFIFINSIQTSFAYRFNVFATLFAELVSLAVFAYLWVSIYRQGQTLGDYSLNNLILYYVLTKFIILTIKYYEVGRNVGEAIREGDINTFLVMPLSFQGEFFFNYLGNVFYRSFVYLLIFIFLFSLTPLNFDIHYLVVLKMFLGLAMAVLINFQFFYMVGVSTFYFGFVIGFNFIMQGITAFFAGAIIPVDLFPTWLQVINNLLPFKFITYFPVAIALNKIDGQELYFQFLVGFCWLIILFFVNQLIFKNGVKKYEAIGI